MLRLSIHNHAPAAGPDNSRTFLIFYWIMVVMLKWNRSEVSFAGCDFWGHGPFPFHKCDALIRFHWILSFQNDGWENCLCFEWISYDNIINSVLRPAFWNCMSTFGFIYLFCNECIQIRCSSACALLIFMCLCPFWPHHRAPPTSLSWNRLI